MVLVQYPEPTPILRFVHLQNLGLYLQREAMHAPNFTPGDGLAFVPNHSEEVQGKRSQCGVFCGPGGCLHDYVPFYFGPLSPMMLQLNTGQVPGYTDGQAPLVYLESTCQTIERLGRPFVFTDGHAIAAYTSFYDNLGSLGEIDWSMVDQRYWSDNASDSDRQRRKQAEFLVHEFVPWDAITGITVIDETRRAAVSSMLGTSGAAAIPISVRRDWYYW